MSRKQKGASRIALALALVVLVPFGAQAANKLIVMDSTGTTNKFVVTDTGSVGINVSNPGYKLHLVGSGDPTTAALYVSNPGRVGGLSTDSGGFSFIRNNDASINGGLPRANDRLGYFAFGTVSAGNKYSATVQAYAEANATATSVPGYITFATTPVNSINLAERVRINSAGNVGIGTTNPSQKLEVNGGVRLNTTTAKPATCTSAYRGLIWFEQGGTGIADTAEVCAKDAAGNYAWKALF